MPKRRFAEGYSGGDDLACALAVDPSSEKKDRSQRLFLNRMSAAFEMILSCASD
jgi:hypothetical protein